MYFPLSQYANFLRLKIICEHTYIPVSRIIFEIIIYILTYHCRIDLANTTTEYFSTSFLKYTKFRKLAKNANMKNTLCVCRFIWISSYKQWAFEFYLWPLCSNNFYSKKNQTTLLTCANNLFKNYFIDKLVSKRRGKLSQELTQRLTHK